MTTNIQPDARLTVPRALLRRSMSGRRDPVACELSRWEDDSLGEVIPDDLSESIKTTAEDVSDAVKAGFLEYSRNGNVGWRLTRAGIEAVLDEQPSLLADFPVGDVIKHTLDRSVFHPFPEDHEKFPGETAIPSLYEPGESGLVLVLGENAGGKSFFRRILSLVTHRGDDGRYSMRKPIDPGKFPVQEFIHLSMEGRTAGGFIGACVYGDEGRRSTGENTAHTVMKAMETADSRAHTNILYWDEPDIGMSAGAAAGAGQAIAKWFPTRSRLNRMVCITSHSTALIRQLVDLKPHYVFLGDADGPATLDEWFAYQQNPPVIHPDEVKGRSNRRWKMIQAHLNDKG